MLFILEILGHRRQNVNLHGMEGPLVLNPLSDREFCDTQNPLSLALPSTAVNGLGWVKQIPAKSTCKCGASNSKLIDEENGSSASLFSLS